jgi:hypothetical protein
MAHDLEILFQFRVSLAEDFQLSLLWILNLRLLYTGSTRLGARRPGSAMVWGILCGCQLRG